MLRILGAFNLHGVQVDAGVFLLLFVKMPRQSARFDKTNKFKRKEHECNIISSILQACQHSFITKI